MPELWQEKLTLAVETARIAGETLLKIRNEIKVEEKGHGNWVTTADRQAESLIKTAIKQAFPEDQVHGEEGGGASGQALRELDRIWIIDPLDGTTNYVRGFDQFAVSIAYWEAGFPTVAAVYAPAKRELFSAVRGWGAALNGDHIHVSQTRSLHDSLVGTGFPYEPDKAGYNNSDHTANFLAIVQDIRRMGAAALDLANLACGRLDGFWEYGLSPWDVAAGILLIEEAGGKVTDFTGGKVDILNQRIVASNGLIHQEMLGVIAKGKTGLAK